MSHKQANVIFIRAFELFGSLDPPTSSIGSLLSFMVGISPMSWPFFTLNTTISIVMEESKSSRICHRSINMGAMLSWSNPYIPCDTITYDILLHINLNACENNNNWCLHKLPCKCPLTHVTCIVSKWMSLVCHVGKVLVLYHPNIVTFKGWLVLNMGM